jgi:hypothetical protein
MQAAPATMFDTVVVVDVLSGPVIMNRQPP